MTTKKKKGASSDAHGHAERLVKKETAGRFEPDTQASIETIAGRKNNLVPITIGDRDLPGQAAHVLVPIQHVIEGLVAFAAADSLEFELAGVFANGDAARLEITRVVPQHKCPKCGAEVK
jgi:hypothetical protein